MASTTSTPSSFAAGVTATNSSRHLDLSPSPPQRSQSRRSVHEKQEDSASTIKSAAKSFREGGAGTNKSLRNLRDGADATHKSTTNTPPQSGPSTTATVLHRQESHGHNMVPEPKNTNLILNTLKSQPSERYKSLYGVMLDTKAAQELCMELGLTLDNLRVMKRKFDAFDVYHSGEITRDEFLMLIMEEKRELTQGIFRFSPMPNTQKYLKFDDFVLCACTFAALTQEELYRYVFDLFDDNKSGFLEHEEFYKLSESLQSKRFHFPKNLHAALKQLNHQVITEDPNAYMIDFNDFVKVNLLCPLAFYPIQNMQNCVRQQTLGIKFWSQITQRRVKIEALFKHLMENLGQLPQITWTDRFWSLFSNEQDQIRQKALERYHLVHGGSRKSQRSMSRLSMIEKRPEDSQATTGAESSTMGNPHPAATPQDKSRLRRDSLKKQITQRNLLLNEANTVTVTTAATQASASRPSLANQLTRSNTSKQNLLVATAASPGPRRSATMLSVHGDSAVSDSNVSKPAGFNSTSTGSSSTRKSFVSSS